MSTKVQEDIKLKLKQPKQYGVYLLNDDFTTFDFVKLVLKEIFDKNGRSAEDIAMKIHTDKIALAGIYSKEVAEYKKDMVLRYAELDMCPFVAIVKELE